MKKQEGESYTCPECGSADIKKLIDPKGRVGCGNCGAAGPPSIFVKKEQS